MRVNPRDGCCRSCNGQLEIVDALDDALTVRQDYRNYICVIAEKQWVFEDFW